MNEFAEFCAELSLALWGVAFLSFVVWAIHANGKEDGRIEAEQKLFRKQKGKK